MSFLQTKESDADPAPQLLNRLPHYPLQSKMSVADHLTRIYEPLQQKLHLGHTAASSSPRLIRPILTTYAAKQPAMALFRIFARQSSGAIACHMSTWQREVRSDMWPSSLGIDHEERPSHQTHDPKVTTFTNNDKRASGLFC